MTKDVYREFTQNGEYGGATLLALKEIATSPNAPIESVTENTVLTSQGEILPVDAYGENVAAGPVRRSDLATYPKQSTVDGEQRTKEPHPITEAYGKRVAERLENERPTPQRPTNKKITKAGEVLVKAIGKSMGIEVEFTDNAVDGVADGKTVDHKKVYISRYTVDPIKEVIKHEFTHTTEISKHYEKIQKYLFDESKAFNAWLESKGYAKWPQMETDIINLYKENGETLDHEGAKTEIVAKFVSENLFEDGGTEVTETFLKELYLKDRNLFDRFVDWVKSVYARLKANDAIKADIIKLEQKFIRLAETAKKQRVKDNQTNDKSGKSQYLFVGKKSKTADKLKLATAKQMLKDGADSETIRKETGWFKGYDGKWRFEISDKDLDFSDKSARFVNAMLNRNKIMSEVLKTPNLSEDFKRKARTIIKEYNATEITEITLGDLIKHDALFEAYPELKNYMVKFKLLHGVGAYHYKEKTISIDPNSCKSLNKFKKIIIHEIQHAVQHYEGFAMGSSNVLWHDKIREGNGPKYKNGRRMTAKAAYMNTAGEIEARDAENRLEYDDAKRESTRPDIDNKNVVFSDEILKKYIASGTQNAQYSIPSDHNYVYTDGKASFTEERLNNLFDEHSLGDGKRAEHSNAYVGYISPEDFVNLTSNENIRSRVEDEAYILNEEELKNEKETPFLEYDPATGEVVNHEGRHRMLALKADGITRVAVLLKPTNDSFERRTPQDISLTGQNFAGGKASGNVTVKTAVPLSEKYREKAIKKFAQNPDADVRYSLPTEGIPSQPLHYVKMYSEAMKDSKIKRLYEEAKNGNDEAAVELADYCFDDKFAKEISNKYNGCYLISINGIDGKSINKIPMVISSTLSKKTNLKNFLGIFKISKNNMRDKTNAERLSEKVLFDTIDDDVYNSIKGKRFVIVDDTVNTGTTTNALARYLEKAGGKVAGTVSLFKGQDHYNNQAITEDLLIKIESRLGRENAEKFIRQYGYADKLEQLTRKQAEHLLKIGIDNSRGTRNAEGGGKTSVEGGGRILSQASGKTKTISTELEADSVDGSVSSLPKKSEEQYSLSDSKYMSAVESGDTKTQEKIVADAAKTAGAILGEDGNPLKLYRGTKGGQTVFSKDVTHNGKIYTTDKVYIASNYGDKSGETTAISEQVEGEPATYALYGFPKKMLTMDAQALPFSDLVIPEELQKYSPDSRKATNAQIAEWAEQAGYDALHIKDVRDGGAFGWNDQYIFFDENLVKSADTVTRDNDGNIIPPSERFNEKKTDIRYSLPDIPDIAVGKSNTELEQLIKDGKITLDDAVNSMNDQYGTMPKGENPKVDVDVPNKVSDTRGVRRFARTALESGHLTDGMTEDAKREILNGVLNYNISSNKMAVTIAENKVKNDINAAVQEWESIVNSGKIPSARDIVLGEVLMVEAAKAGNANDVAMYLAELASMGTQLGQGIQALSLLKKLSGVGQLHYVSRVIAQMNKDLENRYGNKYVNILTLDPDLESILAQSKNPAEIENIIDDILTDVAKQMPSTWADKFNAWRYLAMLGNTRTHIRNFFGNAVFMPAIRLKNTFAAIAEKLTVKNHDNRTKVLKVKKEYKDFAEADFENIKDIITSGGKLSPSDRVQDRRKVFTSKAFAWLEKARKFNFDMLEKEDLIFLKHHYKQALGSVLQARGIDVKNITEQQLASARDYAIEEAQKATYRDFSHFANALNKLAHPTKKGNAAADVLTKAGGLLVEGAVPFKKTPINVLKRGIEYSPLGIATSLGNAAMSAARGEFSGTQLINDLSAGLSGTALLALGMFLQSIGWITGGLGYDDEDTLERMAGAQPYALTIGDVSFTIDWMAPSSLPLLIGAEIQKANEEGENLNFFDKLTTVGEPLTELSFLQGVNDIIEGVAYSGEDGLGTFGEVAANLTSSYISQYFPTLGGQVARTLDDTQRTNFVDKNSGLPKTIQKSAQKIMGKIPFAASEKVPYIDAWGKVAKNDNALLRAFENFVSPGYISTIKDDKVNKELAEIYVDTGESGVIPKRAKNSFKVGSETVNLSADDYVQYATNKGQYSRRYLEDVMSNPLYKDLPSDGKAEAIKFLFEFANAKAKSEVSDYDYKESSRYKTAAKLEDAGISASSYAIAKFAMSEANADTDGSGSVSQKEKKKALKNAGFDYSDIRTIININKK
ncbi:MAG: hypothetical protein IJC36_01520 [Clostridia bacterium]|nr:hypothetical protein [Clostridia bacterium]